MRPCKCGSAGKRVDQIATTYITRMPTPETLHHCARRAGCPHPGMPSLQDIEANLLKQDIAKAKQKEQQDQPAAVAKALELNDAAAMRRRGRMMLPAPQVCPNNCMNCSSPLQLCAAL